MNKKENQGSMEKLFRNIGKKIDDLINEVPVDKQEVKEEWNKRSGEIKRNLHFLEMKVDEFAIEHQSTIQEIEDKVKSTTEKIKKEFSDFKSGNDRKKEN
ncbi:hypothetical protein [Persicobacter diffluens]|uniref:Uncharacterized protein n=1 Tax=Persicobacter diffluens TaxID=981 RepID=A0AAN5AIK0_9BACT|nr:hypothetical protein PEDI_04590 [Persicobacter diffluens]